METYFEKDFAKISYDKTNRHIFYQWLTPPTSDEFKEGCKKLIDAIKHFKIGKAIVDTRQMGTVAGELLEWMTLEWMVKAADAGYTHAAVIAPGDSDVFTSMSVEEIVNKSHEIVVHQYFDSVENAKDWLKKQ